MSRSSVKLIVTRELPWSDEAWGAGAGRIARVLFAGGRRVHRHAGRELREVRRRQQFVPLQAARDFDELLLTGAERDLLLPCLATFDHVDGRDAGERRDRV